MTLLRKKYFRRITKFLPTISFWPQNDPNLTIFTKNHLFHQKDTMNATFDKSYVNKPDRNNFWDGFKKEILSSHHKILTYDVILVPKMNQILPFSPKMTYFDQTEPIMTSLTTFMLINLTKITFETVLILCIINKSRMVKLCMNLLIGSHIDNIF